MWMWKWFIGFFRFSKRETTGIKVLFCLLLGSGAMPFLKGILSVKPTPVPEEYRVEVEEFIATLSIKLTKSNPNVATTRSPLTDRQGGIERPLPAEYFDFDPNTLDLEGWQRLGFTERQAGMVVNYRGKGGRFYQKEDLQKIYAISEDDYLRISEYVVIPREIRLGPTARDNKEVINPIILEINAADSIQLQLLPGIGPAFASRIVNYRDRLGGFHDVSQLLNVYGMDSVRYNGFVSQVTVNPLLMKGIRINQDDLETLGRHPLVGYKLANILIRYREHNPPFMHADELQALGIVEDEVWTRLQPYLIF